VACCQSRASHALRRYQLIGRRGLANAILRLSLRKLRSPVRGIAKAQRTGTFDLPILRSGGVGKTAFRARSPIVRGRRWPRPWPRMPTLKHTR
jgi:hypothetical protein